MAVLSVIIPVFNKEKDILDTLTSVCNQTFIDFEIIIINDGSTDSSVEKINSITDSRIQLFSKKNEGVSVARNFGVEKANSSNLVFLDADDYWYPNHLENLNFLITEFPDNLWFASAYEKKRSNILITPMVSPITKKGRNWFGVVDDFFGNSFIDCLAGSSSICMKKKFFKFLNGFNTCITHTEDIDLWIQAALESPLIFSNKITSRHNLDGSNRSSSKELQERNYIDFNKFNEEENKNSSLKKYLDLNRYSLAIIYKLHEDDDSFEKITKNIKIKNLNSKQRFLLNQNKYVIKLMVYIQNILKKVGIRLSSF